MPFPKTTRVEFDKNPLEVVICQLRFPTILSIGTTDPAPFQDQIRAKYPLYETEDDPDTPPQVSELLQQMGVGGPRNGRSHTFKTADERLRIGLSRDFVSVSDHEYRHWPEFKEELQRAMTALEKCYHPSFYSRIGLRYRDAIDRRALGLEGRPWKELVNPELIGVLGTDEIGKQVGTIGTESTIRLSETEGSVKLQHGLGTTKDGAEVYLFDADFFLTAKRTKDDVIPILDSYNQLAGHLFRWAISSQLHDALGPKAIPTT